MIVYHKDGIRFKGWPNKPTPAPKPQGDTP